MRWFALWWTYCTLTLCFNTINAWNFLEPSNPAVAVLDSVMLVNLDTFALTCSHLPCSPSSTVTASSKEVTNPGMQQEQLPGAPVKRNLKLSWWGMGKTGKRTWKPFYLQWFQVPSWQLQQQSPIQQPNPITLPIAPKVSWQMSWSDHIPTAYEVDWWGKAFSDIISAWTGHMIETAIFFKEILVSILHKNYSKLLLGTIGLFCLLFILSRIRLRNSPSRGSHAFGLEFEIHPTIGILRLAIAARRCGDHRL